MPGLNAAFVDVGYDKDAFLHYLDLGSHFTAYSGFMAEGSARRPKENPLSRKFQAQGGDSEAGFHIAGAFAGTAPSVQIAKEPISSKGPRLTTEISFTGRFMRC